MQLLITFLLAAFFSSSCFAQPFQEETSESLEVSSSSASSSASISDDDQEGGGVVPPVVPKLDFSSLKKRNDVAKIFEALLRPPSLSEAPHVSDFKSFLQTSQVKALKFLNDGFLAFRIAQLDFWERRDILRCGRDVFEDKKWML